MCNSKNIIAGFTLIEILIVIFIISIVALVATLNFGNVGAERDVDNEAYRLDKVLTLTAQTAMTEQTDLGIGLWRHGYTLWSYDANKQQWQKIIHDHVLKTYNLPEKITLSLRVNKIAQILPENEKSLSSPQLWFSATGTALPAVISINAGEVKEDILIENNGNISVKKAG